MTSNDFVYRITYPSTTAITEKSASVSENIKLFIDDTNVPVVILFGWAGSKDEHLAKYSSIYEGRKCITLRWTTSLLPLTVRHDKLPKIAEMFLDLLREKSLDEHPIIFHIFSDSGALFYQAVSLEMQKRKNTLQIKGVIFDSALHNRTFCTMYRAANAVFGGPAFYNVPVAFCLASVWLAYIKLEILVKVLLEFKMPEYADINLDDEPYDWPQLLIYSKNDELNPWEDVEKFAQRREEKGIKITRLCFEDSPHVKHLMTHREIYIGTVLNFMKACLNGNKLVLREYAI